MRMQSGQNNCGPAALANAFRALGSTKVTEDKVVALMRAEAPATDAPEQDGAGIRPLQVAADKLGYQLVLNSPGLYAEGCLHYWLADGKPALLAVDDEEHWVTAIGVFNGTVLIADPADAEIVRPYTWDKLALRWGPTFGALVLEKKPRTRRVR